MDELLVIAAGITLVAWVNWYFFVAGRSPAAAATTGGGTQEITVVVAGGYSPASIRVKRGAPVRLVFDRQETSGCSEELVIPDFNVRRFLPAHERTVIELDAREAGTHEFTCGMGMLRGRITVED